MSDEQSPYNGRPFYCAECGAGFGEYIACEWPDCRLESEEDARKRADNVLEIPQAIRRRDR